MEKDKVVRFEIQISADLSERINNWRRRQGLLEPRVAAIRRLLEAGLMASNPEEYLNDCMAVGSTTETTGA